MLHKTVALKAATTTEQGTFTAIAATYSVDRGNERIVPGAFEATIEQWQASQKMVPVHWDHEGSAEAIIGVVDPMSMKETDAGLVVAGKLDLEDSDIAKEAWRVMKSGALSLSFGYMVTDGAEADDGVYELKAVDLFEVSLTPSPMNSDTRFLSLKSAFEMRPAEIRTELKALRKRLDEIEDALEEPPPAEKDKDEPDESPQASDPEAVRADLERIEALT